MDRNRTVRTVTLFGAIAAAVVIWVAYWVGGTGETGTGIPPRTPAEVNPGSGSPVAGGSGGQDDGTADPPAPDDPDAPPPNAQQLLAQIPPYAAKEAFYARRAEGRGIPRRLSKVIDKIDRTVGGAELDVGPYYARMLFSASDYEWMTIFSLSYGAAIQRRLAEEGATPGSSLNEEIRDKVKEEYRDVLRRVATARIAKDEKLRGWLRDTKTLHQLDAESAQFRWLLDLLITASDSILWKHHTDLASRKDLSFLAATDLPRLRQIVADARRSLAKSDLMSKEDRRTAVRPYAEQFYHLVEPRRPR